VRRSPHSVVLLDELEKAHPDVISILLQVLEDGILTDGKGRTVSFKNCIIVMTSNIGSTQILAESNRHKGSSDELYSKLLSIVKEELEAGVKPEFLNRLDEIVVFSPLETSELTDIARKLLEETLQRAKEERDLDLTITDRILERVRSEGSSQAAQFGARPMRRAVQRFLEDSISDALVRGFLKPGDSGVIDLAPCSSTENQRCKVMIRKLGSVDMEDGINNNVGALEDDDSLQSQPQILVVEVEDFSGGFGGSAPLAVEDTNGSSDIQTSNDGSMTSSDVVNAEFDGEGTFQKKKKKQRSDLLTETSPHA
jgi:AAA domain (Cdc48 subfamily)/C-terminal, D2-small domain, of ClpB protein